MQNSSRSKRPEEPTAEELMNEEALLAEDLAGLEKELLQFAVPRSGIKDEVAEIVGPEIVMSSTKSVVASAPRMGKIPAKKKTADKKASAKDKKKERLNVRTIFEQAKDELVEAGIPFVDGKKRLMAEPISHREVYQKLMDPATDNVGAVARILLMWRPERLLDARHVTSLMMLIEEGRKASIRSILEAISANPIDLQSQMKEFIPDAIVSGTRLSLREVIDTDPSSGKVRPSVNRGSKIKG